MPRPREFDYDEVLEKSMVLFWQQGYLGTSIQDLVERTGVNRASLYSTFGDKHALFMKALAQYAQSVVPSRICILEREDASLKEIREYFEAVVGDLTGECRGRGCLMVNSAVELAGNDWMVARHVADHLARLEEAFTKALAGAAKRGELKTPSQISTLARFLVGAAQGLIVVGKATPDPHLLQDILDSTFRVLR